MSAPVVSVKSSKAYVYGIPANTVTVTGYTGFVVESAEVSIDAQVDDTAIGEDGRVEAHAVGGEAFSLNVSGYCVGDQPPVGTKVTATGLTAAASSHIGKITSIKPSVSNRGFKKFSITAKGFEGVTYV